MKNYSQFGQDIEALFKVYKGKKGGYFVEIGAYDGIESSNTYLMEKEFEWKGICVECVPSKYDLLLKNRSCIMYPYAVYNEDNRELEFYDSGGYSGLCVTNNHKHIINDKKITVFTKKLTTILKNSNAPSFIEYLSIDTEGSEYDILNAHDFDKYLFGYICVEHNNIDKNRKLIRTLLESKGYRFCKVNGDNTWGEIDDEYIHKSIDQLSNIVYFLNHSVKECGVYQYGQRLFDNLKTSTDIIYEYVEVNSLEEYNNFIKNIDMRCKMIIYNYHNSTMRWLNKSTIQKLQNKIKNIGIPHESYCDMFDYCLSIDCTEQNGIPRPLFQNIDTILNSYKPSEKMKEIIDIKKNNIPIFGSFGFAFDNKGFDKIVKYVNDQYDEAIIKILMPRAAFGPHNYEILISNIINSCFLNNIKPNITLIICTDFFSNEDILFFLNSNTMNLFLYDTMLGRGISSVIDYALTVNKPIGISDSFMFRHIYDDSICVYKNSIEDCMKASKDINKKYKELYSNSNILAVFKNILMNNNIMDYNTFHGEILGGVHVDYVLRSYFLDKSYKGIFIDIGAFEPIRISNSYHFEMNGWDVYCFEANTNSIPLLKQYRKNVFNYAVYDENKEEVVFNIVESNGWTAGFSAIELDIDIAKVFPCDNKIITKIKVPQRTLNSILENELVHVKNIDILKIDIEGGELKCLLGLNLNLYHPKIILLENICGNNNIKKYLEMHNYILDKKIEYNEFYIYNKQ